MSKKPTSTLQLIQEVMLLLKPLINEVTGIKKALRGVVIRLDVVESRLRRIDRILQEMHKDDGK